MTNTQEPQPTTGNAQLTAQGRHAEVHAGGGAGGALPQPAPHATLEVTDHGTGMHTNGDGTNAMGVGLDAHPSPEVTTPLPAPAATQGELLGAVSSSGRPRDSTSREVSMARVLEILKPWSWPIELRGFLCRSLRKAIDAEPDDRRLRRWHTSKGCQPFIQLLATPGSIEGFTAMGFILDNSDGDHTLTIPQRPAKT